MFAVYNPVAFNELPHFNKAKTRVGDLAESINRLGAVIKKYNLQYAGVALLHKHFDITDEEILVENETDTKSELSPTSTKMYEEGTLNSYMWKVTGNGKFAPLEFTASRDEKIINRIDEIRKNSEFLQEFGSLVRELKMDNFLGLTVFHRDHVSAVDGSTQELSDEVNRTLVVIPASEAAKTMTEEDHDTIQVVWKFCGQVDGVEGCTHCKHMLGG